MKQLSKHDVNRLSIAKLKEMLPFEVVADGEVVFTCVANYDVNKLEQKPKASHDVNKAEYKLCRHGLVYCSQCGRS